MLYYSLSSAYNTCHFVFPRGVPPHAMFEMPLFEPFYFRGRRGLGSEARRYAKSRAERQARHRRDRRSRAAGVRRPPRHGRRSYSRHFLLCPFADIVRCDLLDVCKFLTASYDDVFQHKVCSDDDSHSHHRAADICDPLSPSQSIEKHVTRDMVPSACKSVIWFVQPDEVEDVFNRAAA